MKPRRLHSETSFSISTGMGSSFTPRATSRGTVAVVLVRPVGLDDGEGADRVNRSPGGATHKVSGTTGRLLRARLLRRLVALVDRQQPVLHGQREHGHRGAIGRSDVLVADPTAV